MRRLAFGLLLCLAAVDARAATCSTVSSCTAANPCDWNLQTTWSCARVPARARGDSCVVSANTTVVLDTDGLDCGPTTVNGTWVFDESALGRDANGYRTFTIGGNLTGNSGGVLQLRAGHRLAFDTLNAARVLMVNDGFDLDIQGTVQPATIVALADNPANSVDCGAGAPGREYTITPDAGASLAHVTGRIVFLSGRARNRQMEIRATSPAGFSVCTDTVDTLSGSNTTGGQRLTPHANRNAFCTAAGTPAACCTAAAQGTCPATPVSRHTEPAPYGNAACTGSKRPYPCCTGAGAGTCTGAIPAVGDHIAIVNDAWIFQSGGTRGYRIVGDLITGNAPMPTLKAVNIANAGSSTVASSSSVEFLAKSGVTTPDLEYVNFHDYAPSIDGIRYSDARNWAVRWSAFHDVTPNSQGNTNATLAAGSLNLSTDNVTFEDNVFYRTQGVGPHLNEGGFMEATGCKFLRNLLFDSCLTGNNECGGMQGDACTGGEAAYNIVYDYYAGANPVPVAFTLGMHGLGASVHHNWIVNSGMGPVTTSPSLTQIQETGLTQNYVSNVVGVGAEGGKYYSNVIRNYGLRQFNIAGGLVDPIAAAGNFILGVEPSIQASSDCTGNRRCGRVGLEYIKGQSNSNQRPTTATDNIVTSLASYPGFGSDGRCVEFDGYNFSGGGGVDVDWNATVEHLTCDGRQPAVPIRGVSFDQDNTTISPSVTALARDIALLDNNDGAAVWCTVQPGVDEVLENLMSLQTASLSESGGDYFSAADCTGAPPIDRVASLDYPRRLLGDYSLAPGSPNLNAGVSPPGSPIGVRAFHFDRSSLQSTWSTNPLVASAFCTGPGVPSACCTAPADGTCDPSIVTFDGVFPADVANVDNRDTDGDGVLDLHDNSPLVWNPDQLDQDGDGYGAVTDCNDLNPAVHPGAIETCDGIDNDCNGLVDDAGGVLDPDLDSIPGICDNCPLVWNPQQQDMDHDGQGDYCDLDDGVIYIQLPTRSTVAWQPEIGYDTWNEYRGDVSVLKTYGLYTQDPQTTPAAARNCDLTVVQETDTYNPAMGQAVFYLVSGNRSGVEGTLGTDSSGAVRPNANPCP